MWCSCPAIWMGSSWHTKTERTFKLLETLFYNNKCAAIIDGKIKNNNNQPTNQPVLHGYHQSGVQHKTKSTINLLKTILKKHPVHGCHPLQKGKINLNGKTACAQKAIQSVTNKNNSPPDLKI